MDKHFLELLGQMLISTAKSQTQFEEITKFFKQSPSSGDEFTRFFEKFYGSKSDDSTFTDMLELQKKAVGDFKQSFDEFALMFELVPKTAYSELEEKCQEQEKEIEKLRNTINKLQNKSSADSHPQENPVDKLTEIIEKQTKEFGDFMKAFQEKEEE